MKNENEETMVIDIMITAKKGEEPTKSISTHLKLTKADAGRVGYNPNIDIYIDPCEDHDCPKVHASVVNNFPEWSNPFIND